MLLCSLDSKLVAAHACDSGDPALYSGRRDFADSLTPKVGGDVGGSEVKDRIATKKGGLSQRDAEAFRVKSEAQEKKDMAISRSDLKKNYY